MQKILRTSLLIIWFLFLSFIFYFNFSFMVKKAFGLSVGVAGNVNYNMAMSEALSQKKTISNSYQINKEISVYALYLPYLSYLERHNEFFKSCDIVNSPKTLNSFVSGVNTSLGIDLYALEYMQKKAELGAKNKMIRQNKVKKYMKCVASYGLIIAAAIDNFHNALQNGGGAVMANNTYKISNNQYYNMVGQSLYSGIIHQSIRLRTQYNDIRRQIKDNTCVIYNKDIKCGGVFLNLESSPKMDFGGLEWFDPQSDFGGMNGIITIGYNKNSERALSMDKNKSLSHVLENTNSLTNDLLNSLF
jgi:hypothetical protein